MSFEWSKRVVKAIDDAGFFDKNPSDHGFLRVLEVELRTLEVSGLVEFAKSASLENLQKCAWVDRFSAKFFEALDNKTFEGLSEEDVNAIKFAGLVSTVNEDILDESIELSTEDHFELQYRVSRDKKKGA